MRRRVLASLLASAALLAAPLAGSGPAAAPAGARERSSLPADLAAARALFERNLDAIRHRDRAAYLACYLEAPALARAGAAGLELGYEGLAKSAGEGWPDVFDAQGLQLVAVSPGIVYGTYRYRVRYGAEEDRGLSERLFLQTPKGWRIAVTTAFSAPPGTPPPPRAIVGATLIDGTGRTPVADSVVVLRNGKIDCAGTRTQCPVPSGVAVTDAHGLWLTPGLIDAHVHFSQTGWADGRPDSLDVRAAHPYEKVEADLRTHPERLLHADLCAGVTAVFDVGGYPWTLDLPARTEKDTRAPHVVAAGPLLSTLDFWLNLPAERQFLYLKDAVAARDGVRYLRTAGAAAVKVWFIVRRDADLDNLARAVRMVGEEARAAGLPLIVHATGLREAKESLRAGAKLLVHSVGDEPIDDEFLALAKSAGTIYCPTLTVRDGYRRMFEAASQGAVPALDDPNGCVDPDLRARIAETPRFSAELDPDWSSRVERYAAYAATEAANLRRVRDARVPIAMGTDAGNPLTLHGVAVYAEMERMQADGMTPMEVVVASTATAARALGREKELGTVEVGKAADLLLLAADPTADIANFRRLRFVVRGGELRPQAELRADAAPAK
ncbi:MAG: amidohydrolase family protein [Acidobacteriota bacterium]